MAGRGHRRAVCLRRAECDQKKLLNPGTDSWPTYNGDYTGRRFSPLDEINASNIKALSLAWVYRLNPGAPNANVGSIKGTPLLVGRRACM